MPQDSSQSQIALSPDIKSVPDLHVILKDSGVIVKEQKSKDEFLAFLALQIYIQNVNFNDYDDKMSFEQVALKCWQAAASFLDISMKKFPKQSSTWIATTTTTTTAAPDSGGSDSGSDSGGSSSGGSDSGSGSSSSGNKIAVNSKEELQNILYERIYSAGKTDADLNDLDVSGIDDFSKLFDNNKLKRFVGKIKINDWDVSGATNMESMFEGCSKFNCDISGWKVGNVTNMRRMFKNCSNFNANLSKWDVSNVTDKFETFYGCTKFSYNKNNIGVPGIKPNGF